MLQTCSGQETSREATAMQTGGDLFSPQLVLTAQINRTVLKKYCKIKAQQGKFDRPTGYRQREC